MLRFTVTLFNFISNPKLTRVNRRYTELVSILIPVRNEADNILALLNSIDQQDYKNYEVIIYDDNSTDETYKICSAFAVTHLIFRVVEGGELPSGWTGKNHACYQLAKHAKGKYLLFIDADETISNNLLNSAVHRVHLHRLGLLSLFANQQMQTTGEKITVPLVHYLLLNLIPLRLIYLFKTAAFAIASGQFMLFDATIYRQNQWHEQVKDELLEDTTIMKLLKAKNYKGEVLLANNMVSCRMYHGYHDAINGFSKNLLPAFNYSFPSLLIYILLLIGGPMIVMMTLNFGLIFFMTGLIILTRIMTSLLAGQNALYNVITHPLQMVNLAAIAFISIQKHLTKTHVWKGRRVQ